jgi:hypothetical protein
MIEKFNAGNYLTNLKNIDPNKRVIHIHGKMERNMVRYAKYYSYGSIIISKGNEFIREINHSRKYFHGH